MSNELRRNDVIQTRNAAAVQLAIGTNRDNARVAPILTFWDKDDQWIISVAISAENAAALARDLANCAKVLMGVN